MTPERFKELAAGELSQGKPAKVLHAAALSHLGEAEALLFLGGGWTAYVDPTTVVKPVYAAPTQLVQPQQPTSILVVKPPCRWELQVVEWCSCPNLTPEQAASRNVIECGHPDQDGALCSRGQTNGRVICCATCRFHEVPS